MHIIRTAGEAQRRFKAERKREKREKRRKLKAADAMHNSVKDVSTHDPV